MDASCLTQAPHNVLVPLFDWSDEITADRLRRQAKYLNDMCGDARICRGWFSRWAF